MNSLVWSFSGGVKLFEEESFYFTSYSCLLLYTLDVYFSFFDKGSKLWSLCGSDLIIWIDSLWHFWHFQATDPLWTMLICCQWKSRWESSESGNSWRENTSFSLMSDLGKIDLFLSMDGTAAVCSPISYSLFNLTWLKDISWHFTLIHVIIWLFLHAG